LLFQRSVGISQAAYQQPTIQNVGSSRIASHGRLSPYIVCTDDGKFGTALKSIPSFYLIALATFENTLPAFDPISRTVLTTMMRITASITEYSAISCPSSSDQRVHKKYSIIFSLLQAPVVA